MLPNTGLALFLVGIAGVLLYPKEPGRVRRLLALLAAATVLLIGFASIAEYMLGIQLPLAQFLFGGQSPPSAARPSPPTAIALILLATAVLVFDWRSDKRARPSEWLVLGAVLIAVTALLSYLYGEGPVYQLTSVPIFGNTAPVAAMRLLRASGGMLIIGVAVPTAMSGLMISLGLLLERPDAGIMRVITARGPGGVLLRRLAPVAILTFVVFGFFAARFPGVEDAALVFASLTVLTTAVSLFLLAITAARLNRAHEILEKTQAQTRELIEQASDGIFIANPDGRFIDVNDAGCRMAGYTREEILTKFIPDLVPPHEMGRYVMSTAQLLEDGSHLAEWMARRKDGSLLPVEINVKILPDGRWQGIVRDISKRKHAEEALRLSEEEQRLLAEVGSVLATSLDFDDTLTNIAQLIVRDLADLCIIDVVESDQKIRRARVICRDPSKEWVSESLMRMPPGAETSPLVGSLRQIGHTVLIEHVTPSIVGLWALTDDQLTALQAVDPKSAIAVPILLHGNLLGSLLLVSSDASRVYGPRQVRMAEAIAQRAAFSLENARLYRTAKRASQIRDDVLGIVAHDLRNPLQIIATNAARLRTRGPELGRQMGVEMGNAAHRMNRLIQDLLDVTSMEAGHLSIRPTRLHTAELVSNSFEALQPLASSAAIDLRLATAASLPDISGDYDRLLQVFENLGGNAIKFTKPGGRITLGAEASASEVVFSVADTGAGIAGSDLPHIFDRFWQASKITRRGAGLGLPIVKGIVEAHGGRVWVTSCVGQGTTFFFAIPTAPQASTTPKRGHEKATLSPLPHSSLAAVNCAAAANSGSFLSVFSS